MKAKYLFGAFALPFALAACSDDAFESNNAEIQGLKGDVIELPEGFALVGSKGEADTRTGVINNQLAWWPTATSGAALDATSILNEENWDRIGLAWLNVSGSQNGQVYTNYKFQHYGWLNVGATSAEYDKCNDDVLTNGVWFTGATDQASQFVKWNGSSEENVGSFWNASSNAYDFNAQAFTDAGLSANRGLFSTSNGTIFGGDYIVYFPFNEAMKDVCYLQAISPKSFEGATLNGSTGDYQTPLYPHMFLLGKTTIDGGVKNSEFTLRQLSGMVAVQLRNQTNTTIDNITSVVLYAKGGGFYTSVQLDASKPMSQNDMGQQLYANVENNTNGTTATLISKTADANGLNLAEKNGNTPGTAVFGFAALPTTIEDLVVIVQDKDGNSYATSVGGQEVTSMNWTPIEINLENALSPTEMYAYDEASLKVAIEKARDAANEQSPVTIHLLGEVELTESLEIPAFTTVEAETPETDKLIVTRKKASAGVVLTAAATTATLDCDVILQGVGCCGLQPAKLVMNGTLAAERTITNEGAAIEFGIGNDARTAVIYGNIINTVDPEDEAKRPATIVVKPQTKVNLYGELNNMAKVEGQTANNSIEVKTSGNGVTAEDGTLDIYDGGILTNDGEMTIYGNVGTDPQGNAQLINNNTITEKVSAQITGRGVTTQAEAAAYICEVNSTIRYEAAIFNGPTAIRPTTLVRFIDTQTIANQEYIFAPNNENGTITNFNGRVIDFESALSDNYRVTLAGNDALHNATARPFDTAVTIGNFTVKSGAVTIQHDNLTVNSFTIDHSNATNSNIQIMADVVTFTVVEDFTMNYMGNHSNSALLVGGKLIVGGDMNIAKFDSSQGDIQFNAPVEVAGTLTLGEITANAIQINNDLKANAMVVNSTNKYVDVKEGLTNTNITTNLTVNANGLMKFNKNSITTIGNQFYNDGKVEIVPQTGLTSGDVAAVVYCKGFTNYGNVEKWANRSYPSVK